jgi:excinuclease UvrABC nuclease subunit
VVGVVKDERHKPKNIIGTTKLLHDHERSILLGNAEAHRFAITFHRKKRKLV